MQKNRECLENHICNIATYLAVFVVLTAFGVASDITLSMHFPGIILGNVMDPVEYSVV